MDKGKAEQTESGALAHVYERGAGVFESAERFEEWLSMPQAAFGNEVPGDMPGSGEGLERILEELGRIEHGIFAPDAL